MFLFEGSKYPYKEVVEKIISLTSVSCPYKIFETITSLEKEILACANRHHSNDLNTSFILVDKFDREVKISVLIYCILKSQNINLIMDVAMVEGFVSQTYLDVQQSFSSFVAVLNFLLDSIEV